MGVSFPINYLSLSEILSNILVLIGILLLVGLIIIALNTDTTLTELPGECEKQTFQKVDLYYNLDNPNQTYIYEGGEFVEVELIK